MSMGEMKNRQPDEADLSTITTKCALLLCGVFALGTLGLWSCLGQGQLADRQREVDKIVEQSLDAEVCTTYRDTTPPVVICRPAGKVSP